MKPHPAVWSAVATLAAWLLSGCAHTSAGQSFAKTVDGHRVRFISTALWNNMPPPADDEVARQLAHSVGTQVEIVGMETNVGSKAALQVTYTTTNLVIITDRASWEGRPSYRSNLMASGYLTIEGGQFKLTGTKYEWVDR